MDGATRDSDAPRRNAKSGATAQSRLPAWKLEDAKARFSELVRKARSLGPQRVTVRGADAVVVIAADEYARLSPASDRRTLVEYLRGSGLHRIQVERRRDRGRSPPS